MATDGAQDNMAGDILRMAFGWGLEAIEVAGCLAVVVVVVEEVRGK